MLRRHLLGGMTLASLSALGAGCAWSPRVRPDAAPIVFVHGNGDSAGVWQNTLWYFESNGWPRERLFALQQPFPLSRDEDAKAQPGRSSTAEHAAFLRTEVDRILALTGAAQVVLVASSRGGHAVRNYVQNGGGAKTVSHAILAGTPNHGIWAIPGFREGSEFAGTGAFLKGLNAPKNEAGDEVTGPVKWLTIRSENADKYAQPDGEWIGAKGKSTQIGFDAPALKGAENKVLAHADHREVAFSPAAFALMYQFITGSEPASAQVWPELNVVLDGMVTGMGLDSGDKTSGNFSNNLPVPGARVEVYAVHYDTGERVGRAIYTKQVGADGRWGPFKASSGVPYEFVVRASGYATTHIYRSAFVRSSSVVHLKADRIADADLSAAAIVQLIRPRGYLNPARYHVVFDGVSPPPGVPISGVAGVASSKILPKQKQDRAIVAEFHSTAVEKIVGRTWPAKENHVVWLEISQ